MKLMLSTVGGAYNTPPSPLLMYERSGVSQPSECREAALPPGPDHIEE